MVLMRGGSAARGGGGVTGGGYVSLHPASAHPAPLLISNQMPGALGGGPHRTGRPPGPALRGVASLPPPQLPCTLDPSFILYESYALLVPWCALPRFAGWAQAPARRRGTPWWVVHRSAPPVCGATYWGVEGHRGVEGHGGVEGHRGWGAQGGPPLVLRPRPSGSSAPLRASPPPPPGRATPSLWNLAEALDLLPHKIDHSPRGLGALEGRMPCL
jgi:hypothetical protein